MTDLPRRRMLALLGEWAMLDEEISAESIPSASVLNEANDLGMRLRDEADFEFREGRYLNVLMLNEKGQEIWQWTRNEPEIKGPVEPFSADPIGRWARYEMDLMIKRGRIRTSSSHSGHGQVGGLSISVEDLTHLLIFVRSLEVQATNAIRSGDGVLAEMLTNLVGDLEDKYVTLYVEHLMHFGELHSDPRVNSGT